MIGHEKGPRLRIRFYSIIAISQIIRNFHSQLLKSEQEQKVEDKDDNNKMIAMDGHVTIICDCGRVNATCFDSYWVDDSSVSYYDISQSNDVSSYNVDEFGSVMMGNIIKCRIISMVDVYMNPNIECRLHMKNVSHILELHQILIFTA